MLVEEKIGVYESILDVSSPSHRFTIIMYTTNTKPGFTKLKVHETSGRYLQLLGKCCDCFQLGSYVANNLFREDVLAGVKHDIIVVHAYLQK